MNKQCFLMTFIICFFSFYNYLWGQSPLFHNVLVPEAMGIYCMDKDEKGLMWIGTGIGLYCYDGYRCYRRNGADTLNPQGIQTLNIERNTIYLGCENGFYSYQMESEEYNRLIPNITEVNVTFLYGSKIYIGCRQGLWAWDKTKQQAESVCTELKQVYAIAEYGEGLLVGTLNGLYFVKDGKAFKRSYSSFVGIIMPDAESDCYWIGTEGNLFRYEANTDTLNPVIELSGNYVKTLAYDSNRRLYIGTDNGLYIKEGLEFRLIRHDAGNPWSIQNNIICDIFIDELQNLWIGSDIGLSMLTHQSFSRLYPLNLLTRQSGGNVIHAIAQDKDGNVWMGGTDGLIRYPKDGMETSVTWYTQSDDHYRILHNRVRAIYNDRDGDVWIITDHGINLYDKKTGQLRNFIVESTDGRFSCRWAYCLCMDEQRNLWIGAYNEGVFVINKEKLLASGGYCKADVFYGASNGLLAGSHVYSIVQDMTGGIWVSSNGGIDRIDAQTYRVKHVSDQFATCMLSDQQQYIWISLDGEIQCLDSNGEIVREFGFKENERPIRFIELIEVENRIWAFTQNDCRVIHPDGNISIFSLPDINVRSACYSSSTHQVLVGGMDNVMYLDSEIADHLTSEPNLLLAELRVNGQRHMNGKAPAFLTHLTLEYDENNLEFCLTDIPDNRNIIVPLLIA